MPLPITVTDILVDPSGKALVGVDIKVVTQIGAGSVLSSAEVVHTTGADGVYSFDLEEGTHDIYVMHTDTFESLGTAIVNDAVPSPVTINELLYYATPILPDIVKDIYDDVYGCIDCLENDINTCIVQLSCQVVQGDVGVCQAMTTYTNDCLGACSAELTTAMQAGDAQAIAEMQVYTDEMGTDIACCTTALNSGLSQLCTTMTSITEANGMAIADVRTDMEAGDALISQQAHAYTDACTGIVEANIVNYVEACNASVYECMFAIDCCIVEIDENSSKIWYEAEPPTSKATVGDIWYDIDDENEPYYFTAQSLWESLRDTSISVVQADANAAQAAADLACICSCAYADGVVSAEEARAIADASAKADEAARTACVYAEAEANLVAVCSCAYADGIVTAEEARAIADAQEKADIAEANAIAASDTKGSADAALIAANLYAESQANLAQVTAEAYADGVATQAELDAIAAAEQEVAEAEARLNQEMDNKDTACNNKVVACTDGLTGSIELLKCDICDVSQGVALQQSGYNITTCAGEAIASINLLATSYTNTAVACSEIVMRADKLVMWNGCCDINRGQSYPFMVCNDAVYMNHTYVNYLCGTCIESPDMCAGSMTAGNIQSSNWVPDETGLGSEGYKLFGLNNASVTLPDGTVLNDPEGLAVFNNIVARGAIYATSGSISGDLVVGDTSGNLSIIRGSADSESDLVFMAGASSGGPNYTDWKWGVDSNGRMLFRTPADIYKGTYTMELNPITGIAAFNGEVRADKIVGDIVGAKVYPITSNIELTTSWQTITQIQVAGNPPGHSVDRFIEYGNASGFGEITAGDNLDDAYVWFELRLTGDRVTTETIASNYIKAQGGVDDEDTQDGEMYSSAFGTNISSGTENTIVYVEARYNTSGGSGGEARITPNKPIIRIFADSGQLS